MWKINSKREKYGFNLNDFFFRNYTEVSQKIYKILTRARCGAYICNANEAVQAVVGCPLPLVESG